MDPVYIEFLFGGFFVILYSWSRFSSNRAEDRFEVRSRYVSALLSYIFVYLVLYIGFSFVISLGIAIPLLGIDEILNDLKNALPGEKQQISAQLVAALFLTEAVPRMKKAATADNKLRFLFQRMVSLSSTAQNLSSKFQYEPIELYDEDGNKKIEALKLSFDEQGLDKNDIQIDNVNDGFRKPKHIWTRMSLLWISINEWRKLPEFYSFFNSHLGQFISMNDEYKSTAEKVFHCFALTDAVEKTPELKDALKDCADHYSMQLKKHLQKVSDFMSCALLNVKKGDARFAAIRKIGFKSSYNQGVSIDLLVMLFLSLFTIFIIVFGVFHWSSSPKAGPFNNFFKSLYDCKQPDNQYSLCFSS